MGFESFFKKPKSALENAAKIAAVGAAVAGAPEGITKAEASEPVDTRTAVTMETQKQSVDMGSGNKIEVQIGTKRMSVPLETERQSVSVETPVQAVDLSTEKTGVDLRTETRSVDLSTEQQGVNLETEKQEVDIETNKQRVEIPAVEKQRVEL